MHKALGSTSNTGHGSTDLGSQTEVGGSEVQGHLRLQSKVRDVQVYSVSKIN